MINHHLNTHTEEELWKWSINMRKIKAVFQYINNSSYYTNKNGVPKKEPKIKKPKLEKKEEEQSNN